MYLGEGQECTGGQQVWETHCPNDKTRRKGKKINYDG